MLAGRPLRPVRAELEELILNGFDPAERDRFFARQIPESSRAAAEIALGRLRIDPHLVGCPVLSVSAELDRLVWSQVGAQLAAHYRCTHQGVAGRGHYALVGEPGWDVLADEIASWVLDPTGSTTWRWHLTGHRTRRPRPAHCSQLSSRPSTSTRRSSW